MADNESARSAFKIRGALVGLFLGETHRLVGIGAKDPEADVPSLIAFAAAKSLAENNGFDREDQARRLVRQLEDRRKFPRDAHDRKIVPIDQWDPAILRSALEFREFFNDPKRGRDPKHRARKPSRPNDDTGSGAAVRAVALGAYFAAKDDAADVSERLTDETMQLALMTHGDARAGFAAVAIAAATHLAATTDFGERPHTSEYGAVFIRGRVTIAERRYRHCHAGSTAFSERLALAIKARGDTKRLLDVCLAREDALCDVPLAIACWLNHPRDFQAGVGRDSIFWLEKRLRDAPHRRSAYSAALTGALIGASIGTQKMLHMMRLRDVGLADLLGVGLYRAGK